MAQAICDITTDEVNVDVVVEPQADTMVEVANRAGGMEQVFHDETLIGNGNSVDLGVNTEIIATKEYVDEKKVDAYTKSEIDNKITVINTGITGNAQAIQKTRDDMNAEDGRLQTQITAHASELTTLRGNQASLGDQVAGIESKIPDASGTNHLITKQQLLDEEMDIREDLNEGLSELQTQVTAQAAEIAKKQDQLTAGDNIVIRDNVISATGAGGGTSFSVLVVQELPATGQSGVIYLVPKDGTAPDVYDEYVWITATHTFELIGSTKVDLSGYLPLSGGTLTGNLKLGENELKFGSYQITQLLNDLRIGYGSFVSCLVFSYGLKGFYPGIESLTLGVKTAKWPNVYAEKLNNGADLAVPTEGGTLARLEDLKNIDTLPDQTGNAGKVLMTDGASASWQEAPAGGTKITIKRYN